MEAGRGAEPEVKKEVAGSSWLESSVVQVLHQLSSTVEQSLSDLSLFSSAQADEPRRKQLPRPPIHKEEFRFLQQSFVSSHEQSSHHSSDASIGNSSAEVEESEGIDDVRGRQKGSSAKLLASLLGKEEDETEESLFTSDGLSNHANSVEKQANNDVYEAFLDILRKPEALDLLKRMKSFIVACEREHADRQQQKAFKQLSQDEETGYLRRMETKILLFFDDVEQFIRRHPIWANACDEVVVEVRQSVEKYVETKLYRIIFAVDPRERAEEVKLSERMRALEKVITPDLLGVPVPCRNEVTVELVQEELRKLNQYVNVWDKVACIERACNIISKTLSLNSRVSVVKQRVSSSSVLIGHGADEFVPALIYCALHAKISYLWGNVCFIRKFIDRSMLLSHAGYCFTTLESAVHFYRTADEDTLFSR